MTNPHNVDICVTCVSDKPPQLPLREELPSLGIEVVYNAHGVGAKASKHESKKLVKEFREKEQVKELRKPRFFPSSPKKMKAKQLERQRQESALRVPKALSYSSYQKRLLGQDKGEATESSSSVSSWETSSTVASSSGRNNQGNNYDFGQNPALSPTQAKDQIEPPKTVEFPTHSPEELALSEAFKVFSHSPVGVTESRDGTQKSASQSSGVRESSESREPSSGNDPSTFDPSTFGPSTLTTVTGLNNIPNQVSIVASGATRNKLPGLTSSSVPSSASGHEVDNSTLSTRNLTQHEQVHFRSSPAVQLDLPNLRNEESSSTKEGSSMASAINSTVKSDKKGSIKMQLIRSPTSSSQATPFYDLTEISDDEDEKEVFDSESMSKDLSTLSSKKDAPTQETLCRDVEVYPSAAIQRQLPGLRLRIPEIDDGYGHIVLDLSEVAEDDGPHRVPRILSSSGPRVIHAPHKRNIHISDAMDDIMQSPTDPTSHCANGKRKPFHGGDGHAPVHSKIIKSLFDDDASSFEGKSNARDDESEPLIHSPRKAFSHDSDVIKNRSQDSGEHRNLPPLSPALKSTQSKESESYHQLKVSFSQDVEERYFNGDGYRSVDSSEHDRTPYDKYSTVIEESGDNEDGKTTRKSTENITFDDEDFNLLPPAEVSGDLQEEDSKLDYEESQIESPEILLLAALSYGFPIPEDFKETLERNPDLASTFLPERDQFPLHAACARNFPDRFSANLTCRVEDLVKDVIVHKDLIAALVSADSDICLRVDENGDLPVHILARQLMEWEARWYQKVYEKARDDNGDDFDNATGITKLYQTMSQCIDSLLKPIATKDELCKQQGSVGQLLPLHIAAIFTVSYDTLKLIIEKYPEAASEQCDLQDIQTFIPNDSVPLELHDRLSTDFPKWEIENVVSVPKNEIKWTQSILDESYGTKGGMRRSDLMFSFYPDVSPYRHDTQRIWRLESRIRHEVAEWETDEDTELSSAVRLLWTWMCTYQADDDDEDNYVSSVERIIRSLSYKAVKYLAAMPAPDGKPIIDKALPECSEVIRASINEIAEVEIPIPMAPLVSGFDSTERSFLLRQWDEDLASRFCLHGRGFVGPLCRSLFNITESSFPSSFVLLPYKLVKDDQGRLGLESAEAAAVAMKFADCLLRITQPKKIMHFLEKKATRFLGTSLRPNNNDEWIKDENDAKEIINRLLSLYEKGPAYFYFLDEFTGVPIVPDKDSLYPLVVNDPVDTVRKMLPLMLTGMVLMRGEKAISVIANVLLSNHLDLVQSHWVDTAKDLVGYLYSPQTEWTTTYLQDLLPLRDRLVEFIERGPSENTPEPGYRGTVNEWVVEFSLVRTIVDMHDSKHTHSGLRPRRAGLKVLWTREADFLNPSSRDHLFHVDFKSILDLKERSSEEEEKSRKAMQKKAQEHQLEFASARRTTPESDSSDELAGYGLLFGELSLITPLTSSDDEVSQRSKKSRTRNNEDNEPTTITPPPVRKSKYASAAAPISLLSFDDDLDLDDVLQLRILLDEQEAKLEFLREKIADFEVAEQELMGQEEKIGDMIDEINNQKNYLLNPPSKKGISRARNLLLRICDLEERVLCREVEVGQLKNDISCFELEASQRKFDDFLFDEIEY